jgi:Protein of unknown function (DUF1549)/Protein of unknown function (DUF1553)/Planctomycete cytochrome C
MMLKPAIFLSLLSSAALGAPGKVMFEKDVRPILKAHCTHCHGEEEKPEAGLDLRLRRFMDEVVVPGQHTKSKLVEVIRSGEMPKEGKKVTADELAIIERWIEQGALTAKPEPESLTAGMVVTEEDRQYWAFQPIRRPEVPSADPSQVTTAVDAFVLKSLHESGLKPAAEADRATLIRRVMLDLTGLPPTPDEVQAFVTDTRVDAYERLVERLLSSQAYGERWARHWLDVVGYADSNGYAEKDSVRLHAWRFRDYVVRSLNEDKPWDRFITEQIAGDELAGANHANAPEIVQDAAKRDMLVATGFLRMGPDGTGDSVDDVKLAQNQVVAEQIKITTSSLLGLTVACAQCHDHRYDPISQADYYSLRAVFDPAFDWEKWRAPAQRLYSLYSPDEKAQAAEIEERAVAIEEESKAMSKKFLDEIFEKEVLKLPEVDRAPFREARATATAKQTPEQKTLIKKYPSALALYSLDLYDKKANQKVKDKAEEAKKLRDTKPKENFIMAMTEVPGRLPASHLFHRGDHEQPKQPVTPAELTILTSAKTPKIQPQSTAISSGRRLTYAQWLTSGEHPLVARVLVNRFWLHHFGRGIVNTPGDFGMLGERPTHPELLDYLASEFMRGGWRLKPLHRLMVLSHAYRQSSTHGESLRADPENKLYARFKIRRLDAETLRDSMIATTGMLNRSGYGEPVGVARDLVGRIVLGKEKLNNNGDVVEVESLGADSYRRALYVQVRRKLPLTVLDAFDAPTMVPNCEMRASSTVATQSLLLLNDSQTLHIADLLAARLQREKPGDLSAQIRWAWQLLYHQEPSAVDVASGLQYLTEQTAALKQYHHDTQHAKGVVPDPEREALASLCQIFYSSNRFLYIE